MTDWELGNDLMHRIADNLREISKECKQDRPKIAAMLENLALDFGPLVNRLMSDDDSEVGMCPSHELDSHGAVSCYTYFDGTSKKVYDKYERKGT